MTTARSSRRNRHSAALVVVLAVVASVPTSAHRRDEYLQAARIAIDPGRVQVELDLTPGIAVAPGIIGDIDRNRNDVFDVDETHAYSEHVLREIRLEVDGRPVPLALIDRRFPTQAAMSGGEGTIQLHFTAAVSGLVGRGHRVFYRNDHRADIGVYLANALAPTTDRVAVITQKHAVDQRDLVIEYALDGSGAQNPLFWWVTAGVVVGLATAGDRLKRRRAGWQCHRVVRACAISPE